MSRVRGNPETSNRVTLVEDAGGTVNIHGGQFILNAGGTGVDKTLEQCTKEKSRIRITGNYKTLHEPTFLPSPQMRNIKNYYEGGYCETIDDEFEIVEQIATTGEPITTEEFFHAVTDRKCSRMALIGGAGFGKTTELKKLAQKLLERKNQSNYETDQEEYTMIHYVDLKKMRLKQSTTLQDCLFGCDVRNADDKEGLLTWIANNQSKAIFLIDGLDQARWDPKTVHDEVPWWEEASTETLMYNLMSRNIFPYVKIIMTSRESAISTLPESTRPDVIVALTGFKEEDAERLFFEVLGENEDQARQDMKNFDLITIPIYVIFTAIVYKYCSKAKEDIMPNCMTGLLAKILEIFTRSTQMQETNIEVLHKMMSLAYEGMRDGRMTFGETDLKRHGLTLKDVSDMMSEIPRENIHPGLLMEGDLILIFCHQTLEEFLAACYISKMAFKRFMALPLIQHRRPLGRWSVVFQYLCGITLNSQIKFPERLHSITAKSEKQKKLRYVLDRHGSESQPGLAYYIALHESNDDDAIRGLTKIEIHRSPLTSSAARAIPSLMRKSTSVKNIVLNECGLTNDMLSIMADNMPGPCLEIEKIRIIERNWDVTCKTLNSFLASLKVNFLEMLSLPVDYLKGFENLPMGMSGDITVTNEQDHVFFKRDKSRYGGLYGDFSKKEKVLRLEFFSGNLQAAVKFEDACCAEKVEITGKGRCWVDLKFLHEILNSQWKVNGQDLCLEVKVEEAEPDALVIGCSDIREAVSRWSVKTLAVRLHVRSREVLQKFKDEIGNTKLHHFILLLQDPYAECVWSYTFDDDDFVLTSSISTLCQVEHLELDKMKNPSAGLLKSIVENSQLSILECWRDKYLQMPSTFPVEEFNRFQEAASRTDTKLLGIVSNRSGQVIEKDSNADKKRDQGQSSQAMSENLCIPAERNTKDRCIVV